MKKFAEVISGKRLNFFIGAGTSSSIIPTLSILDNAMNFVELLESPFLQENNLKKLIIYYYCNWVNAGRFNEISKQKKYQSTVNQYVTFLTTLVDFLSTEPTDKPRRINLFTTNFDPMFELAFDEILKSNKVDCFFCDGGVGFVNRHFSIKNFYLNISHSGYFDHFKREIPTINLLKLHGSVTWKDSNGMIEFNPTDSAHVMDTIDNVRSLFGKENIDRISELLRNNIYETNDKTKLIQEINKELDKLPINEKDLNDGLDLVKKLPIINPMDWKFMQTVFEQNYFQLIRALSYELESPDSVLISIGSSFSDTHINEIIKRSMNNPKLLPIFICYNKESLKKLKIDFPESQCRFFPSYDTFKNDKKFFNDPPKVNGDLAYLTRMISAEDFNE